MRGLSMKKNNNPIKKTSDGCVVKDIPKLNVL